MDLALSDSQVVYVVNRSYENRPDGIHITVCTLNEEYIREFGEYGEGDGQFMWPSSIALDAQGNVYISDEWSNRISIFDKDGKFLGKWGKAGSGDGELNRPSGLAVSNGALVVSDTRNHRIQKFTPEGQSLGVWGGPGREPGKLHSPWGLVVDRRGRVHVLDTENHRVQRLRF